MVKSKGLQEEMHRARFYTKEEDRSICCLLCPQHCRITEGMAGFCGARRVVEGELYSANYGFCAAAHWDPIEKKPLYHYLPGQSVLSLGTLGCNLSCRFCQNWTLARGTPEAEAAGIRLSPQRVLEMLQHKGPPDTVLGAAYTYNEPTVWYEFVYDTARLLHSCGYRNVMVTNGFISLKALKELLPVIDAFNIDVKAFSDGFYRKYCLGALRPVLEAVELAAAHSHVEVTCLLIPTLNDDLSELEALSQWLGGIDRGIPLHFSRYFPQYQLDLPSTPLETLKRAREIARRSLHYVYLGNVDLPGSADTLCPRCGTLLIRRRQYAPVVCGLAGNHCDNCAETVPIIFLPQRNIE